MLTSGIICLGVAFFLTASIYKITGLHPPDLPVQIINSLLGIFLYMLLIRFCFAKLNLKKYMRAQNIGMFGLVGAMIKAMEQIGRGDFNVRVEGNLRDNETFGELVQSVNNLALELNQMEQMRQEFIANVSHEIQSPLTSIRGFAQALRNDQLSAADRLHYLSIIEAEGIRLSTLSENMLQLASLETKTISFQPKSYRLDKQIKNIILTSEPQWVEKKMEMEVYIDEITITADEAMLSQVWINLLHNSIKFTPVGGRVRIDLHQRGDMIEFKISDTGFGIAEEDLSHIFERFYKADKSRERSNKGSGLGLAIAKKIIEMHHGTIEVRSNLGAGATFTVSLPER